MDIKTVTTYESSGEGLLTADKLRQALKDIPSDAVVNVSVTSSQREGDWWRVVAKVSR